MSNSRAKLIRSFNGLIKENQELIEANKKLRKAVKTLEDTASARERVLKIMEEMASAPKEELGKREPGEINAYERYNRLREEEQLGRSL